MLRPLALVALVAGGVAAGLATAAVAFRSESTHPIEVGPVVVSSHASTSLSTTSSPAPTEIPDGLAVGPDGTAPELVIVDHGKPEPADRTRASTPSSATRRKTPAKAEPEAPAAPASLESEPLELSEPEASDLAQATRSVRITPEDAADVDSRGGGTIAVEAEFGSASAEATAGRAPARRSSSTIGGPASAAGSGADSEELPAGVMEHPPGRVV